MNCEINKTSAYEISDVQHVLCKVYIWCTVSTAIFLVCNDIVFERIIPSLTKKLLSHYLMQPRNPYHRAAGGCNFKMTVVVSPP
jgi:hypothetical protein